MYNNSSTSEFTNPCIASKVKLQLSNLNPISPLYFEFSNLDQLIPMNLFMLFIRAFTRIYKKIDDISLHNLLSNLKNTHCVNQYRL